MVAKGDAGGDLLARPWFRDAFLRGPAAWGPTSAGLHLGGGLGSVGRRARGVGEVKTSRESRFVRACMC
jgi:hypothetical protein